MRDKIGKWKRGLAAMLTLAMLLGLLPTAALAADASRFTDT